jgi:hypothetical protein
VNGSRGASETNAEGTSGAPVAFVPLKFEPSAPAANNSSHDEIKFVAYHAFSNHELRRLTMRAVLARVLAGKVFLAKFLAGTVLAGTVLSMVPIASAIAAPAPAKPAPAKPAATKLAPTDIQNTFFDGKPFTATTPSNLRFKMTFMADGKMKRQPIGAGSRGEGTWKLSKDGFCTMWKGGKDSCFTVVSAGDNKWSVLKGSTIMATWSK